MLTKRRELMKNRKVYDNKFKAKVAFEAAKEEKTLSELSGLYGIHPNQISKWKKRLLESLPDVFSEKRKQDNEDYEKLVSELYKEIGQLKVELDWMKKKSNLWS
jgi:putative transposase